MPSAQPGPNGFPAIQLIDGKVPAASGFQTVPFRRFSKPRRAVARRLAPAIVSDRMDRCLQGQEQQCVHGTSSKTHCDFDYSGTMMEQMLLGLVAHRAGKNLEYDAATGRVTNSAEANDYLKRDYRPNWTLNG